MSRFFIGLMGEDEESIEDCYYSFYSDLLNEKALHRALSRLERSTDMLVIEDTLESIFKAQVPGRAIKISTENRKRYIKKVLAEW